MTTKRLLQRLYFYPIKGLISLIEYVNGPLYIRLYTIFLRHMGVKINGTLDYIHKSVKFDDFNLIMIGNESVISFGVYFLTHDFSRIIAYKAIGHQNDGTFNESITRGEAKTLACKALTLKIDSPIKKNIEVGSNVFIGANTLILPGTIIGNNCIIGASSVLRGEIPDGSVVIGNPGRIVGNVYELGMKWINGMV